MIPIGGKKSRRARISGGTIDNAVIGGTTAASGAFTTVTASGQTVIGGATALDTFEQLDIIRAGDSYAFFRNTNPQGVGNGGIIEFYQKNGNGGEVATSRIFCATDSAHATAPGGRLSFWTRPNGGALTERVRIDDDGNVGIGTTTPSSPLHVSGTTNDGSSLATLGQAGSGRAVYVTRNVASATRSMVGLAQLSATGGADAVLDIQQTTTASNAIVVTSDGSTPVFSVSGAGKMYAAGNVGIGDTSPAAKLTIANASAARGLQITNSAAATVVAAMAAYSNEIHTGTAGTSLVSIDLDNAASTGTALHIKNDGSGYGLHVEGTANISGDVILSKTITAPGTTGAQTINKSSGRVNFAAAATSLVVTNSLVTANSIIVAMAATNDSTGRVINVVAGAGSFTINVVAPAAEMAVNFLVTN